MTKRNFAKYIPPHFCSICGEVAIVGKPRASGGYTWRCGKHIKGGTARQAKDTEALAKLKQLGLLD